MGFGEVTMKIAVLGSGNGGCAIAADLAIAGHEISMFDFEMFPANIRAIQEQGGIHSKGKVEGFAPLAYCGHDLDRAIRNADYIFVVGPAYSITSFAEAVRPIAAKGQSFCICPSSNCGAILFKHGLGLELDDPAVTVSETSTLPYACRCDDPGSVTIYHKLTGGLYFATLPATAAKQAFTMFRKLYPHGEMAGSLLMTMMQTGNSIIHPSITLLNASRIESTQGNFLFYEEGATPASGRLMRALDDEKQAISGLLDIGIIRDPTVKLLQGYNTDDSYENGYRTAPGFKGIKAQSKLDHRYLNEDVGYGLVFLSELGKQIGIPTPVTDAVILLASIITERDFRAEGHLTPSVLGIDGYSVEQLKNMFSQKGTTQVAE